VLLSWEVSMQPDDASLTIAPNALDQNPFFVPPDEFLREMQAY
jgi:hypothetical protein